MGSFYHAVSGDAFYCHFIMGTKASPSNPAWGGFNSASDNIYLPTLFHKHLEMSGLDKQADMLRGLSPFFKGKFKFVGF